MNHQIITFEKKDAYPLAKKRFIEACGLDLSTEKHSRMMEAGSKAHERSIGGAQLQALVSYYGPEICKDKKLVIDGIEITCNYIEKIPEKAVEGVYLYLLTAGQWTPTEETGIMERVYLDIWGSNYVDAGINLLRKKLMLDLQQKFKSHRDLYLSEEIGPGYFGMPITEINKFFQLMDGELIGVQRENSGVIIPEKTCIGLYIILNDHEIKAEPKCTRCQGNLAGCNVCKIKDEIEEARQ